MIDPLRPGPPESSVVCSVSSLARRIGGDGMWRGVRGGRGSPGGGPRWLLDYRSDITFTRTSEAAAVDPRQGGAFYDLVTPWPAADVPRILPDGAILIEGSRTNLVRTSGDLNAASFTQIGITSVGSTTAPDGSTANARITPTSSPTAVAVDTTPNPVGLVATLSAYARGVAAARDWRFNYVDDPGAANVYRDPTAPYNVWERAVYQATDHGARCGWANDAAGSVTQVDCWGLQIEEAAFASSPIRTTGVTATRAVEIASYADNTALDSGKWSVVVVPTYASADVATSALHSIFTRTSTTNALYLRDLAGVKRLVLSANSVTVVNEIVAWAANAAITITVDWDARALTVSGLTSGNGTYSISGVDTWSSAADNVLRVGSSNSGGASVFFGVIGRPRAA